MAGYSGTPLTQKIGIKAATRVLPLGAPVPYDRLVGSWPRGAYVETRLTQATDIVHLFSTSRTELTKHLRALRTRIRPDAAVWVSWPKRTSGRQTDLTEDAIRAVALPLGFVDVKVCAVDEIWSGLKLVIRRELRGTTKSRR